MANKRKKPRNLKKMVMAVYQDRGFLVGDVETKRGPCTFDLFGVADLLAVRRRDYPVMGRQERYELIQVTSLENRSSRLKRLLAWKDREQWPGILTLVCVDKRGNFETSYH